MHYELEEVIKDVYPDDSEFDIRMATEIGIRKSIRYKMIPMKSKKIVCRLHTYRQDGRIFSCKVSPTPFQNSSFDGSFIAGMAQLRYIYSMPVERIVKYFNDNGFHINKATANGLLSKTADMFENLYKALGQAVLNDDVQHLRHAGIARLEENHLQLDHFLVLGVLSAPDVERIHN